jgi:hypothetical protein
MRKPQRRRLTTQHTQQPVTTRGPQVLLRSQLLYRGSRLLHHRGPPVLHHQGTGVLHHNLRCSSLLHRGSQALHHQRIGVLRDYVCSPSFLHRGSQVLLCSSLLHQGPEYYSAPCNLPTTEAAECCAVPTFYTAASPSYYVDPNYYSEVSVNYTKIYAAPSYYTEAFVHCNTKAPEYYTTTYASQTYYTESLKYYSAPSYNTTTASDYYIPTYASLASL